MAWDWDELQRQAGMAGILPDVFWSLTCYEFNLMVEGAFQRFQIEGWLSANYYRAKRMPSLASIMQAKPRILEGKLLEEKQKRHEELRKITSDQHG